MSEHPRRLKGSERPLVEVYDCAMLDLDGVVYVGREAVAGASDVLATAGELGIRLAYVTNNASRPPAAVAEHLVALGVDAGQDDVVTSAQAAAGALADRYPAGSNILLVGGDGLTTALTDRGLTPVHSTDADPVAVVQGFHPSVGWAQLAEAAHAVNAGAEWVATNLDLTVPTDRGIAPGNGTLVNAVAAAVGRRPDLVAGKPFRPLFDETVRRVGCTNPLVVGDRLDTDIAGATGSGADSLLVMTGVTDVAQLCSATDAERPDFIAWTLDGLLVEHATPTREQDRWRLGGWQVAVAGGALVVEESGDIADDGLRAVVAAAWSWYDEQGADDMLDVTAAAKAVAKR